MDEDLHNSIQKIEMENFCINMVLLTKEELTCMRRESNAKFQNFHNKKIINTDFDAKNYPIFAD